MAVRLDSQYGKGSHAMLYYGSRKTIVPGRRRDIHRGLLAEMLRQLGLDRNDI